MYNKNSINKTGNNATNYWFSTREAKIIWERKITFGYDHYKGAAT